MNNELNDTSETEPQRAMSEMPELVTTDSEPGEEQFEEMVTDCVEKYQNILFDDDHYYGPAMDASLRYAIRTALADEGLSPSSLYAQFGKPDADDLREAIEDCPAEERREMWEKAPA